MVGRLAEGAPGNSVTLSLPRLLSSTILAQGTSTSVWCPWTGPTQLENFSSMGLSWETAAPVGSPASTKVSATTIHAVLMSISSGLGLAAAS